jgi:hypothetical protein
MFQNEKNKMDTKESKPIYELTPGKKVQIVKKLMEAMKRRRLRLAGLEDEPPTTIEPEIEVEKELHNVIKFKLDSEIEVKVDAFSFDYTYAGLLLGTPNEELNRHIFENLTYPNNWGTRAVLKIKPSIDEFQKKLKLCCYSVWLSSEPMDLKFDGSNLVVIWFDNTPNGKTIEEIIQKGIKSIDWKAHAQDFHY